MTDITENVLLTIDDEPRIRESIAAYFEDSDFIVHQAENGLIGLARFREHNPDIVLVDLRMPEFDGLDVLKAIREESPETPVVVVSGTGILQDAIEALRLGAWDYLTKPIHDMAVLEHAVNKCLERARLIRENRMYHERLEEEVRKRTAELERQHSELEKSNNRLKQEIITRKQSEDALETLFQSTVGIIEQEFCDSIVMTLCEWLQVDSVMIGKITDSKTVITMSMMKDGKIERDYSYQLEGTPCEIVLKNGFCVYPEEVGKIFVDDPNIKTLNAEGYVGVPLQNKKREAIGILWAVSTKKLNLPLQTKTVMELIAGRAATEIERGHAVEQREQVIQELESKNAELERFTYTVSHDLKSPLITIKGFLGLLEKDYQAQNTERMKSDMKYIADAADKMYTLLNELLALSRIGRIINEPEIIPFKEMVQDVISLLSGTIQEKKVEVLIYAENTLEIYGDKPRIQEVLQNLIENSIKFMGKEIKPKVEIGSIFNGKEHELFVKDNGIGINPKYHEKIFGLFDRLNSSIDGTGIGLAMVKRIIEVHGGKIRVESEENQGTTFWFTLPQCKK